jgi:hypothetical protein
MSLLRFSKNRFLLVLFIGELLRVWGRNWIFKYCVDKFQALSTVPWLRLVSGLSMRRPGFKLRTFHLRFVVYIVALREFFLIVLWFIPVSINCTIASHSFRLQVAFTRKTNGRSLGTLQKRNAFSKVEELYWNAETKRHPARPDTLSSFKFWPPPPSVQPSSHNPESSPWNPNNQFTLVITVRTVSCQCVGDTLGDKHVTALS